MQINKFIDDISDDVAPWWSLFSSIPSIVYTERYHDSQPRVTGILVKQQYVNLLGDEETLIFWLICNATPLENGNTCVICLHQGIVTVTIRQDQNTQQHPGAASNTCMEA